MRLRPLASLVVATGTAAGFVGGLLLSGTPVAGQGTPGYRAPRSVYNDGKPDINGVWQALNTANWNIEAHEASPGYSNGPAWMLGALVAEPPGAGVVEGGTIPYRPEGLERRRQHVENRLLADVYKADQGDPEMKCFLPGPIRATYMPQPFQILQTDKYVNVSYQFANANRIIHLTNHQEPPVDTWMGWSNGRWEGDTLVVDVLGLNGYSWFDRAGNFLDADTKLTERYTRIGPDHMRYEVSVDNPAVYARPWKMTMPLYRIVDPNDARVLEFKCVQYSEQAMFGRFTKGWKPFAWDPSTQQPVR